MIEKPEQYQESSKKKEGNGNVVVFRSHPHANLNPIRKGCQDLLVKIAVLPKKEQIVKGLYTIFVLFLTILKGG